MKHQDIYNLSKKYSPPKVNLRQAQILDDYGDDSFAKLPVEHDSPEKVKREEFDYYGWIYPFVEPEDLLFYLYAIVIEYESNKELDSIDSFMYSMDREINGLKKSLTGEEKQILINAFKLIWEAGNDDSADWYQCQNLQKLIGISLQ